MKEVKRRRDLFALLLLLCAAPAMWFTVCNIPEATMVFGGVSMVWLAALILQSRRLHQVQLIWDNRILLITAAIVLFPDETEKRMELNLVISTFGALVGTRVYKWGCDGVRLRSIEIDRKRICLSYGDDSGTERLELLHDIADMKTVTRISQTLWHETGIAPTVNGW